MVGMSRRAKTAVWVASEPAVADDEWPLRVPSSCRVMKSAFRKKCLRSIGLNPVWVVEIGLTEHSTSCRRWHPHFLDLLLIS